MVTKARIKSAEIFYPESDGKPMADNTKQWDCIASIKLNNEAIFMENPAVAVMGDLFWYPVKGNNKLCVAPDVMIVFGRPKGYRGSYKQWEEDNIAPQVVFEILSPSNNAVEMRWKRGFYERFGVEEYYIYDPDNLTLEGWRRIGRKLIKIEQMQGWVSPRLGIKFELDLSMKDEELRLYRPDGTPFVSFTELEAQKLLVQQQLQQERQRAEQEGQRAEQEYERAEQERSEKELALQQIEQERQEKSSAQKQLERLMAQLRALGHEPEK